MKVVSYLLALVFLTQTAVAGWPPIYPITKHMVCAALLKNMRERGHGVPEVSASQTEITTEYFREFRRNTLGEFDPTPSLTAVSANSEQRDRFSEVAGRIAGFELHAARPDTLTVWGSTIVGQKEVNGFFEGVESLSQQIRKSYQIPSIAPTLIGLVSQETLLRFNVSLAAHLITGGEIELPQLAAIALAQLALGADFLPHLASQTEFRGVFTFIEQAHSMMKHGATNQWLFLSRNDRLTQLSIQDPTSLFGTLFSELQQSTSFLTRKIFQTTVSTRFTSHPSERLPELADVATEILLYFDDEGIPHLMIGMRFDQATGKVQPPQRRGRHSPEEDDELIPSLPQLSP